MEPAEFLFQITQARLQIATLQQVANLEDFHRQQAENVVQRERLRQIVFEASQTRDFMQEENNPSLSAWHGMHALTRMHQSGIDANSFGEFADKQFYQETFNDLNRLLREAGNVLGEEKARSLTALYVTYNSITTYRQLAAWYGVQDLFAKHKVITARNEPLGIGCLALLAVVFLIACSFVNSLFGSFATVVFVVGCAIAFVHHRSGKKKLMAVFSQSQEFLTPVGISLNPQATLSGVQTEVVNRKQFLNSRSMRIPASKGETETILSHCLEFIQSESQRQQLTLHPV